MPRFQTSDGLSLYYDDDGAGLPVLCLPGLTRNGTDFDDLAAALDRPVRLIRLTSRGRGQSDRAEDFMTYSVPIEARDTIELLEHLGLQQVVIVGTSRGGIIAMLLAANEATKQRLAGVILNDIGPELDPLGLGRIMDYLGVRPKAANYVEAASVLAKAMGGEFENVSDIRWAVNAERWFEETPDGLDLRYDARLRDAVIAQSAQPATDMWPLFDALDGVPLALIRGQNSDLLSSRVAARMRDRRPDMIFADVPGRGHVPFLDESESIAAIHTLIDKVQS